MRNILSLSLAALIAAASVHGQQLRYDDVVRNLRNPDPEARLTALKLLRESRHTEAIEPIAPLVLDPMDGIQLAAIDTELSFWFGTQICRWSGVIARISGVLPTLMLSI